MTTATLSMLIPVVVACCTVAFAWKQRAELKDSPDQPVCGKCDYSVQGAPGLSCPECGADWREVGIKTPEDFPSKTRATYTLIFCIVVAVMVIASMS